MFLDSRPFSFDLPEGSTIFGDKAYDDYPVEDLLAEADIQLLPFRKKNLPKHIHAVSSAGFELKVALFVLALSFSHLL